MNLKDLAYHWEVFKLRWLRVSAYTNRLNWDVYQPILIVLYKNGLIREKPLRLIAEERLAKKEKLL